MAAVHVWNHEVEMIRYRENMFINIIDTLLLYGLKVDTFGLCDLFDVSKNSKKI